jgi:putative nucleotidyltransferase with HDIG domain
MDSQIPQHDPKRSQPQPPAENPSARPYNAHPSRPPIQEISELKASCSLPGPLFRVLNALTDERGTKFTVARALEEDPDLAERVLKAANSPIYVTYEDHIGESGGGITNLPTAVLRIGLSSVRNLAYTQGICQLAGDCGELGTGVLAHLLVVAEIGWSLGDRVSRSHAEDAYLAGLLHDFGKIVLLKTLPEDYATIAAWCRSHNQPTREAEEECFRQSQPFLCDHVKTGTELMRAHFIPEQVLFTVERHHDTQILEIHGRDPRNLTATVIAANQLAYASGLGDGFGAPGADYQPIEKLAAMIGREPEWLRALAKEAFERGHEAVRGAPRREPPVAIQEIRGGHAPVTADAAGDLPQPASADYRAYEKLIGFARAVSRFSLQDAQAHTAIDVVKLEDLLARLADKGYVKRDRRHTYHHVYRALPPLQRSTVQEILSAMAVDGWRHPGHRRAA